MDFVYSATVRNLSRLGVFANLEEILNYCRNICIREDEYSDVFGFVFADHSVILIRKSDGKPTF